MAISVLEWQNGDIGKRDYEYFIMLKNFAYHDDPLFVMPNGRGSGFYLKLTNKMGLSFIIEGEFYARLNEAQTARPGQNIDDILMPYVREFPNIPEFPHNIDAQEFQMPQQPNPPQLHIVIQPPVVLEIAPEREGQDFDQNGRNVVMSADITQNVNIPIEPPRDNMVQDENAVPIEPMPLEEALPLIDEILHDEEEERNIELIFVEDNNLEII